MTEDDKMLQEEQIDDTPAGGEARVPADDGSGADGRDTAVDDQKMADPDEVVIEIERDLDESGESRQERSRKGTKKHDKAKAAKRTSRKELLERLAEKNELLSQLEAQIRELEQDLKKKEDKALRIAAEFENYKKRTRREWELLNDRAKAELITDILGVLDDFDRALEALGERDDHVADGVRLIVSSLKEVMSRAGLREIEALGQPFDPQFHEAVGETDTEDAEDGAVAHIVQKGYTLNEVLLRPAKVIVSKKK